jgi:hypothetical protein
MSTTGHAARQTRRTLRDVSLDEDQELRARRVRIADQIREVGITAAGSVLQAYNVCGTATCRCHTDPARRHGPYWQHTRKVGGKTVTRRLTAAQAALYLQWIGNDRRLRGLLAELEHVNAAAREKILSQMQDP